MNLIKRARNAIIKIINILKQRDMLILPGALAFFFILAIVPFITLIFYGASLFHVSIDFISSFLEKAFGGEVASLVMPFISDITISPSSFVPLAIAFFAASGGASSLIVTSNHLYQIENTTILKRTVKAWIMTFILILIVVFLLLIPAFGNKFIEMVKYVNMNKSVTFVIAFIINISQGPISWLLIFSLIKIIYTLAPDEKIPSSCTTKGSLWTTFGLVISTGIYSFYVNHIAKYDLLYGGLSHFVVLLIWFYIISYVIIIGIAINSEEKRNWKK